MWPAAGAILGLVLGSFIATLVLRWPAGLGLGGRSRCDHCAAPLGLRDLLPLLSFAVSGGRCRQCGAAIDRRHPAIEAAAMAIGVLAFTAVPGIEGLAGATLGWFLVALVALDIEHHWLPDALTLPLIGLGLVFGAGDLSGRLIGAAVGGGALLLLSLGYRAWRGRDGLGLGDVKLMAALGAWLSIASLPPLLFISALTGLLFVGAKAWRDGSISADTKVPFGACLAAAGFPLWLFGTVAG